MTATTTTTEAAITPSPTAPTTDRMRAATRDRYGDSSVVTIAEVDRPAIDADEVLVRVHAAGLDRGTEHLMTGRPWLLRVAGFGLIRPKQPILGLDVAGTVAAVGADVTRFAVGDAVFGIAEGSFAEFAAAKERKLAHKPSNVRFDQAAVAAVSGITALQALTDVGRVVEGQRVLVIGASGGVGSFAVQIARTLGATVDGIAGTSNLDLVRSLGADRVYDHRVDDLSDIDQTYDLVLDIGGRNPIRKLRRLLTATGTLVIVGGENGNRVTGGIGRQLRAVALSPFLAQRLTTFISSEARSHIEALAELLGSGAVVPAISSRFTLEHAAEALRQMEAGGTSAKTAIIVAGEGHTG